MPGRPYALVMPKIYTKTGDMGETGLIGGKRVPKNHVRVEAYGTVDEANALLGIILAGPDNFPHRSELEQVQGMLFEIGAVLADPLARHHRPNESDITHLEQLIDVLMLRLPPQTSFILPSGTSLAATLHLARTVVRRAERRVVTVSQGENVPAVVSTYLNRLSDYLHTLARYCNFVEGVADRPWQTLEK